MAESAPTTVSPTMISSNGSFVRWQKITIQQLTYAINLIHLSAVGTLAFGLTILRDEHTLFRDCTRCLFLIGTASLLVSIGFGIWCVINRLRDFRATTKAARKREEGKSDAEIASHRLLYERLGDRTWKLFWTQITAFAVGISLYSIWVLITFRTKLF